MLSGKRNNATRRKPMKAKKDAMWDEYGNLVGFKEEKPEEKEKIENNEKEKEKETKNKEKKKKEAEKAHEEYIALKEKVMKTKSQKTEMQKPKRSASVSNFSDFIKRQNDSAKKHVQEPKKEVQRIKYCNKMSETLTKNKISSVLSARTSREPSVVSNTDYLNDFDEESFHSSKSRRSASVSTTKRKEELEKKKEIEERQERIKKEKFDKMCKELKKNEVKPKIIRRAPNMEAIEELAKPKSESKAQKLAEEEANYQRTIQGQQNSPKKQIKKHARKVPRYITEINSVFKKL